MRSWGLKPRFIIIALTLFLAAGVLSYVLFLAAARGVVESLGTRFAVTSTRLARARILGLIQPEVALARKLADSPVVKSWMADEKDPAKTAAAWAELDSYRRAFADRSFFVAVDASGTYYNVSTTGDRTVVHLSKDRPSDAWYFRTLETVDGWALNLEYDPHVNVTKVWINCIVARDGRPIGLAGSAIDISSLLAALETEAHEGLSVTLVDSQGAITASQDLGFLARNARRWTGASALNVRDLAGSEDDKAALATLLASKGRDPEEVRTARITFDGAHSLVAAAPLAGLDWSILAAVDLDRMLTVRSFALIPIVFLVALIALVLVMALLVDRLILVPLGSLTAAAREVAQGRYDVTLPAPRADEIGVLSSSFSTMAAEVRAATANLEEQVRQRTRQLAEANEHMTQDLAYADLVQRSILPGTAALDRCLPQRFILFRPRDKVGGDFYFFKDAGSAFIIGIADCTGHGVSGALMSMYTQSALESISGRMAGLKPDALIRELDRTMRAGSGDQEQGLGSERGLDIAIARVEPAANRLSFAGAGIDLFVSGPGSVERVRGSKGAVGSRRRPEAAPIRSQEMTLDGRSFYMTSDGALDLGGGPRGFGFGSARFAALAASCRGVALAEQRERFAGALEAWRGDRAQRDDITVLAFTVGSAEEMENGRQTH